MAGFRGFQVEGQINVATAVFQVTVISDEASYDFRIVSSKLPK